MNFNYVNYCPGDNQSTAVADDERVCEPKAESENMTDILRSSNDVQKKALAELVRILYFVDGPKDSIELPPDEECLMDTVIINRRCAETIQWMVERLAGVIGV